MTKELINQNSNLFEQIKRTDENSNEFWTARTLAKALEYTDFRNFLTVIEKAKEACVNSGQPIKNHLVEFNEMVPIGSGPKDPCRAINSPICLLFDCPECRSFKRDSGSGTDLFRCTDTFTGNPSNGRIQSFEFGR